MNSESCLSHSICLMALLLTLILLLFTGGISTQSMETDAPEGTNGMIFTQVSSQKFDFEKQTVLLNSGYEMPIIGLGTWTLNDDEAENSVYHALKSGMRLIDTARYYGNEVGVGRGLQKDPSQRSFLP